jgi:hypothetical protein
MYSEQAMPQLPQAGATQAGGLQVGVWHRFLLGILVRFCCAATAAATLTGSAYVLHLKLPTWAWEVLFRLT